MNDSNKKSLFSSQLWRLEVQDQGGSKFGVLNVPSPCVQMPIFSQCDMWFFLFVHTVLGFICPDNLSWLKQSVMLGKHHINGIILIQLTFRDPFLRLLLVLTGEHEHARHCFVVGFGRGTFFRGEQMSQHNSVHNTDKFMNQDLSILHDYDLVLHSMFCKMESGSGSNNREA